MGNVGNTEYRPHCAVCHQVVPGDERATLHAGKARFSPPLGGVGLQGSAMGRARADGQHAWAPVAIVARLTGVSRRVLQVRQVRPSL